MTELTTNIEALEELPENDSVELGYSCFLITCLVTCLATHGGGHGGRKY